MMPHEPSPISPTTPTKFPPPTRSTTLPIPPRTWSAPTAPTDRTLLAPEDAIYLGSPPHRRGTAANGNPRMSNGDTTGEDSSRGHRRGRNKERMSSSRRRKVIWKKLLWVKQSYPDNYTDQETFLEHLQRNPRLQPYDFWPLVADSTVIVQQVCSVIIFIVCFVGIFQERVSPVTVVGTGTLSTVLGWVAWDRWVGQEQQSVSRPGQPPGPVDGPPPASSASGAVKSDTKPQGAGPGLSSLPLSPRHSHSASASSLQSQTSISSPIVGQPNGSSTFATYSPVAPYGSRSSFSPRNQQRLATAKSAVLIYCALLGLSPILKSLTRSTSSDSIWALSTWLMIINVFFFDYGGNVGVKFQASLSTNAALMASTVLASRLPSTQHVFSLTLFSIEVFGLFPVFRRHLRHVSWRWHVVLTALLVMGAGGGVGMVVTRGGWKAAVVGMTLGNLIAGLAMGGCSWWLIGLQRYKNEIHGPWDPARPIIRRHWEDY
ncbi:hypothetical protein VE02_03339 [Pseudogymnoascus sp. 03VT05]|nr:hypothetical protein VE02_03339 [Pseudogymnoascus sp. 03VT05]